MKVVLPGLLDERGAHDQRVLGEVDDGQRRHRQHEVPRDVEPARQELASTPGVISPPIGKTPGSPPIPTQKTISRIIPNQNSGME